MNLGILGGGSWGTALAVLWANKGHRVKLWARNAEDVATFQKERRNTRYLPDIPFPENLTVTNDLNDVLETCQVIGLAVPLQAYRRFLRDIKPKLTSFHKIVILSKGIEMNTYMLPSQIVANVLGSHENVFTLSGPSFAKEVAKGMPTTVVLAGPANEGLHNLQLALNCANFRTYRNGDLIGVELAGALKNVIAIASGMCQGLNLGSNTIAGLITRGLVEISRLGVALGAHSATFSGLAGMGDLILTCTGSQSRNLRVGMALASGKSLDEALQELGMVAEGVHTCRAAHELAEQMNVDVPITDAIYRILYDGLSPQEALKELMTRSLKSEMEDGSIP